MLSPSGDRHIPPCDTWLPLVETLKERVPLGTIKERIVCRKGEIQYGRRVAYLSCWEIEVIVRSIYSRFQPKTFKPQMTFVLQRPGRRSFKSGSQLYVKYMI